MGCDSAKTTPYSKVPSTSILPPQKQSMTISKNPDSTEEIGDQMKGRSIVESIYRHSSALKTFNEQNSKMNQNVSVNPYFPSAERISQSDNISNQPPKQSSENYYENITPSKEKNPFKTNRPTSVVQSNPSLVIPISKQNVSKVSHPSLIGANNPNNILKSNVNQNVNSLAENSIGIPQNSGQKFSSGLVQEANNIRVTNSTIGDTGHQIGTIWIPKDKNNGVQGRGTEGQNNENNVSFNPYSLGYTPPQILSGSKLVPQASAIIGNGSIASVGRGSGLVQQSTVSQVPVHPSNLAVPISTKISQGNCPFINSQLGDNHHSIVPAQNLTRVSAQKNSVVIPSLVSAVKQSKLSDVRQRNLGNEVVNSISSNNSIGVGYPNPDKNNFGNMKFTEI